jgi:hypothetical protein
MTQATVDALLERFGVAANVEGGEPSAGIQSANFPTLWNYLARMQKPGRMEQTQQQQTQTQQTQQQQTQQQQMQQQQAQQPILHCNCLTAPFYTPRRTCRLTSMWVVCSQY